MLIKFEVTKNPEWKGDIELIRYLNETGNLYYFNMSIADACFYSVEYRYTVAPVTIIVSTFHSKKCEDDKEEEKVIGLTVIIPGNLKKEKHLRETVKEIFEKLWKGYGLRKEEINEFKIEV